MFHFIYAAFFIAIGIYALITPYEKLKERFPNSPIKSAGPAKVFGAFILILGIIILAITAMLL